MKTLILTKGANKVSLKVDIFAKNSELQEAGFDTRFTNMVVEGGDDAAIQAGLDFSQVENHFRGIVKIAQDNGFGLSVADINEAGGTIELVAEA